MNQYRNCQSYIDIETTYIQKKSIEKKKQRVDFYNWFTLEVQNALEFTI